MSDYTDLTLTKGPHWKTLRSAATFEETLNQVVYNLWKHVHHICFLCLFRFHHCYHITLAIFGKGMRYHIFQGERFLSFVQIRYSWFWHWKQSYQHKKDVKEIAKKKTSKKFDLAEVLSISVHKLKLLLWNASLAFILTLFLTDWCKC